VVNQRTGGLIGETARYNGRRAHKSALAGFFLWFVEKKQSIALSSSLHLVFGAVLYSQHIQENVFFKLCLLIPSLCSVPFRHTQETRLHNRKCWLITRGRNILSAFPLGSIPQLIEWMMMEVSMERRQQSCLHTLYIHHTFLIIVGLAGDKKNLHTC